MPKYENLSFCKCEHAEQNTLIDRLLSMLLHGGQCKLVVGVEWNAHKWQNIKLQTVFDLHTFKFFGGVALNISKH